MVAVLGLTSTALSAVFAGGVASATASPHDIPAPAPIVLSQFSSVNSVLFDNVQHHLLISGNAGLVATDAAGGNPTVIPVGSTASGMVIDPSTDALYVALPQAKDIDRIDLSTLTITRTFDVSVGTLNSCPASLALDGSTLWFGQNCGSSGVQLDSVDLSSGTVTDVGDSYRFNVVTSVPGLPHVLAVADGSEEPTSLHTVDVSTNPPTVLHNSDGNDPNPVFWPWIVPSPDGSDLYSRGYEYKSSDLSYVKSVGISPEAVAGIAFHNGDIAVGAEGGNVDVYGPDGTTLINSLMLANGVVDGGLAWSSTGTLYAITNNFSGTTDLYAIPDPTLVQSTLTVAGASDPLSMGVRKLSGKLSFVGQSYDGKARTIHVSRTDSTGTHQLADATTSSTGSFTFSDSPPAGRIAYSVSFDGDATHAGTTGNGSILRQTPFDVNGDGYADLVVGSPLEDVGSVRDAGSFYELFSHASGVTGTGSVAFTQDTSGVPGVVETGDQFGYSQASGDFNGDGYADVAVSSNTEAVGSTKDMGTVTVFYGSPTGLKASGSKLLSVDGQTGDFTGESMAVGDFNGDGYADLAFSQAGEGDVMVSLGSASGLTNFEVRWSQASPGVPGTDHPGEAWGLSVAAGDVNGDGFDDLAVGAPFDYDEKGTSDPTGSATVIYGSSKGLTGTGAQRFTPDTAGVPGSSHTFGKSDIPDDFGWQVVLADFNGDGKADLAVSAPGTPVTDSAKHEDAGTVTVLYSNGATIGTAGAQLVTQATAGMPGSPGKGDRMGWTMAAGNSNGDGYADLAIYSQGDYYVTIVKGGASGLSYSTAVAFTENSSGIAGSDHAGDDWGGSLRFESFKGAGPQGLAVGADGTSSGKGSVTVLYSSSSGVTGTGSAYFDQNSAGVPGTAENGDAMGSFFSF
jgi:hypothetical protein